MAFTGGNSDPGKPLKKEPIGRVFLGDKALPISEGVIARGHRIHAGSWIAERDGRIAGDTAEEQTNIIFNSLHEYFNSRGTDIGQIVKITAEISSRDDSPGFNRVYDEKFRFSGSGYPARSCTISNKLPQGVRVRLAEVIAVMPQDYPAKDEEAMLYASGQLSLVDGKFEGGSLRRQAEIVFNNLQNVAERAKADLGNVQEVQMWLPNSGDYNEARRIYHKYVLGSPLSFTLDRDSHLLIPDAKIEVDLTVRL